MTQFQISKATKTQAKGRIGLVGPAGSGKTYTALTLATVLAKGGKILAIDSEARSSEKYADIFDFDILPLDPPYSPETYTAAIKFGGEQGYSVVIIDSLSHAWAGQGGALEMVDAKKSKYQGNSYVAWRDVTPMHNALVEAMLQAPCHIIACMRSKTDYVQDKDPNTGKTTVRKVGMQPVQREGMDYEFDIVFDIDWDHQGVVTKTRMASIADLVVVKPGPEIGERILAWLEGGEAKRPEPVLVVEAAKKPEPRTQVDLLAVGKEFGLDGKGVGAALKKAGISEFKAERWDEMVTAVKSYQPE